MFPINDMFRHDSDVSLSHNFKDKSHYVKNGRHFCKMASKMADTLALCIRQYFFWNLRPTKPIYIESTLKALRLLVSELDVLLWKWPPFCKMASQCQIEWCGTCPNTFF